VHSIPLDPRILGATIIAITTMLISVRLVVLVVGANAGSTGYESFSSGSVAGTAAGYASAGSGSCLGSSWKHSIRHDADANDCHHGHVYELSGVQEGHFGLPDVDVISAAIYFSRFKDMQQEKWFENVDDLGSIPLFSRTIASWQNVDVKEFFNLLEKLGVPTGTASYLTGLLVAGQWTGLLFNLFFNELDAVWKSYLNTAGGNNAGVASKLADLGIASHHYIVLATVDGMYHSFEKY